MNMTRMSPLLSFGLYLATGAVAGIGLAVYGWLIDQTGFLLWGASVLASIGMISLTVGWAIGTLVSRMLRAVRGAVGAVIRLLSTVAATTLTAWLILTSIHAVDTVALVSVFGLAALVITGAVHVRVQKLGGRAPEIREGT